MAPLVPALAQSESKARFFGRLGLLPTDPVHKRVYALMKMEAAEARRRLLENQSSSTAQIHEIAWQQEVLRIYDQARTETKAVYQFGHDTADREIPDNWIIRWLLWHVFRYRDYRNKARPPDSSPVTSISSPSDEEEIASEAPGLSPTKSSEGRNRDGTEGVVPSSEAASSASSASNSHYWDPIRDQWIR